MNATATTLIVVALGYAGMAQGGFYRRPFVLLVTLLAAAWLVRRPRAYPTRAAARAAGWAVALAGWTLPPTGARAALPGRRRVLPYDRLALARRRPAVPELPVPLTG